MAFRFKHGDRPLDGYVIQRGIGRGGCGEVYYARSDSGKEVALKYLRDNPDMRYTSDGDVNTVAFPKFKAPFLRKSFAGKALPY